LNQWREYAANGEGVCLGLRVLSEKGPSDPRWVAMLMRVEYSEEALQASIETDFQSIADELALQVTFLLCAKQLRRGRSPLRLRSIQGW
jgi:hypothetical protein